MSLYQKTFFKVKSYRNDLGRKASVKKSRRKIPVSRNTKELLLAPGGLFFSGRFCIELKGSFLASGE